MEMNTVHFIIKQTTTRYLFISGTYLYLASIVICRANYRYDKNKNKSFDVANYGKSFSALNFTDINGKGSHFFLK